MIARWLVSTVVSNARTAGLRRLLPLLASFTRGTCGDCFAARPTQFPEDVVRASQLYDVVVEPDAGPSLRTEVE